MIYNFENEIRDYFNKVQAVLSKLDTGIISEVANLLIKTLNNEGTIYIFGNGGSAATASHFQNDFNRTLADYTPKNFKVNCLSDNISTLTAIANDFSYDEVFAKQLENQLSENDIVIAISGSGNSLNVIRAVEYAKIKNVKIVSFTGFNGGKLRLLSDYDLNVGIDDMQITEDVHLIFNHLLMTVIKKSFTN